MIIYLIFSIAYNVSDTITEESFFITEKSDIENDFYTNKCSRNVILNTFYIIKCISTRKKWNVFYNKENIRDYFIPELFLLQQ